MFWICLVAGLVFLTVVGDFSLWITGGVLAFVAVTWAAAGYDARRRARP